jgi:hypothetical protein
MLTVVGKFPVPFKRNKYRYRYCREDLQNNKLITLLYNVKTYKQMIRQKMCPSSKAMLLIKKCVYVILFPSFWIRIQVQKNEVEN